MGIEEFKNIDKMLSVQVNIELGTKLLIEIDDVNFGIITSTFVGLRQNDIFISSFPTQYSAVKHKLFPGNPLVIKYLSKGTVYIFPTKVMGTINKPTQLLILLYPSFIQSVQIRSIKRTDCAIPVKTRLGHAVIPGIIKDISHKGVGCVFVTANLRQSHKGVGCVFVTANLRQINLEKDQILQLQSRFPGVERELDIKGLVRNVQKKEDQVIVGIEFTNLNTEAKKAVSDCLTHLSFFSK